MVLALQDTCHYDSVDPKEKMAKILLTNSIEAYRRRVMNSFTIMTSTIIIILTVAMIFIPLITLIASAKVLASYIIFIIATIVLSLTSYSYYINTIDTVIPFCTDKSIYCQTNTGKGEAADVTIRCRGVSNNCNLIELKIKLRRSIFKNDLDETNLSPNISDAISKAMENIHIDQVNDNDPTN